jgi:hypothetical protein
LEGIEVSTKTEKVVRTRRMMIELILAMCPGDKLIQDMARRWAWTESVSRRRRRTVFSAAFVGECARRWWEPMPSTLLFEETEER